MLCVFFILELLLKNIQSVELNLELKMIEIIVYPIVVIVVLMWCYFKWINRRFEKLADIIPGPRAYPFIGSGHQFLGSSESNENNIFLKTNKI